MLGSDYAGPSAEIRTSRTRNPNGGELILLYVTRADKMSRNEQIKKKSYFYFHILH